MCLGVYVSFLCLPRYLRKKVQVFMKLGTDVELNTP